MKMSSQIKKPILPRSDKNTAEVYKTGDWRNLKPEIKTRNSVCWSACPIHNRIRDYMKLIKDGQFERAWQVLIETNPLPAVLGRVCPHPCETECLRGQFDQSLAINIVEKLLGDMALLNNWKPEVKELTPRLLLRYRIAVIGAGPAGLACAYQLRRMGHWVEIFEAEEEPGGMLYFGIPPYRLEKDLLKKEIKNNILSLSGIDIQTKAAINSAVWPELLNDFDTVLIAVGNQKSKKLNIEGEEDHRIIGGLEFLKKINLEEKPDIGQDVLVIGGGNTAVDAARSAKMAGAKKTTILYRRREQDMPAFRSEVEAAKKEGVEIMCLFAPAQIEKMRDGTLKIGCVKMALGEPDKSGRPKPIPQNDSLFDFFAHNIIVAVGEETDLSFTATGIDGDKIPLESVFVAGDASYMGAGTVAAAIGAGNKAAFEIDSYLKTGERNPADKETEKIVRFSDLNLNYFDYRRGRLRIHPLIHDRETSKELMIEEAERCFSCGACNDCGNCWLYCPDVSVFQKDGKFEINYEYCKGCGICANECPRNAIEMKGKEEGK